MFLYIDGGIFSEKSEIPYRGGIEIRRIGDRRIQEDSEKNRSKNPTNGRPREDERGRSTLLHRAHNNAQSTQAYTEHTEKESLNEFVLREIHTKNEQLNEELSTQQISHRRKCVWRKYDSGGNTTMREKRIRKYANAKMTTFVLLRKYPDER